jgi:hypothetical protein
MVPVEQLDLVGEQFEEVWDAGIDVFHGSVLILKLKFNFIFKTARVTARFDFGKVRASNEEIRAANGEESGSRG